MKNQNCKGFWKKNRRSQSVDEAIRPNEQNDENDARSGWKANDENDGRNERHAVRSCRLTVVGSILLNRIYFT